MRANPFPNWPAVLTLANGRPVTTADQWWKQRRPEIAALFEREVVGRIPAHVPRVAWSAGPDERATVGGRAATVRRLTGRVDNAAYPAVEVAIRMTLTLPEGVSGKVPVLVMLSPTRPNAGPDARVGELVAAGWGTAVLDPASVQADNGAGLTRGIIGLVNKGQPRRPDDWGALRAWGWGRAGCSTISAPCPPSMRVMLVSRACRATARRLWSPWRSTNASTWR